MPESILSVGVDIGTTTTQLVFSRLTLENTSSFAVPRVEIVGREILYESEIYPTPQDGENRLDGPAIERLAAMEYEKAGFRPEDIDTGAVIITGEAARKRNARVVLDTLSHFAGDFVVSTAGPDLESIIAGRGASADELSKRQGGAVANLDIGGGTTNIALFQSGQPVSVGCYDIGGRLLRIGPDGTLLHISPPAALVARSLGLRLEVGEHYDAAHYGQLAARMNRCLEEALGLAPVSELTRALKTPGSSALTLPCAAESISFSGGVADCIWNPPADDWPYGDLGALLGWAVRQGRLFGRALRCPGGQTIRATVIGAGSYTTTVSGSTIAYSEGLFPLKNVPVMRVSLEAETALRQGEGGPLREELLVFLTQNDLANAVLALRGGADIAYATLKAMAGGIAVAAESIPAGEPLLASMEGDCAKALGQCLKGRLGERPFVCLDQLRLGQGDYLDMGKPLMGGLVVPVVIKTLIFG